MCKRLRIKSSPWGNGNTILFKVSLFLILLLMTVTQTINDHKYIMPFKALKLAERLSLN
jgi:hypothetical protein